MCPNECRSELGNTLKTVSRLHVPFDPELFTELNTPTYNLGKTGRIQFNHDSGTKDDIFWALAPALNRIKEASKPLARK